MPLSQFLILEKIRNKEYLDKFLNHLPLGLCFVNPLNIIIEINDYFQKLTNYSREEIIRQNINILFSSTEKGKILRLKEKIFKEKKIIKEEITLISKDKKETIINILFFPLINEKKEIKGYFLIFFKKPEREEFQRRLEIEVKQKTQALRDTSLALLNILEDIEQSRFLAEKERDKTMAIIENFPEGLLFFDKENKLISANFKIQEIFEVEEKNLILQKRISELKKIHSLFSLIKCIGEELKPFHRKELELKKDLILEISVMAVISREEKIGTLVILRNITREKIVERLKNEFVSITAHQLRTPLSSIKWVLKMLLEGDLGMISKEQRNYLEKTYKDNERIIRLVNDLLNVTRIEEGRLIYKLEKENIVNLLKEVIESFKESGIAKNKNLKSEFIKEEIIVQVDKEKFILALQNLIGNAFCYTVPGGNIEVRVKPLKDFNNVLISIKDDGIGIPVDQQKRVFSRFFRASNAVKYETDGTGLGLFIAKNIIESHKGKIWFESKENEGSTFYFVLPIYNKK